MLCAIFSRGRSAGCPAAFGPRRAVLAGRSARRPIHSIVLSAVLFLVLSGLMIPRFCPLFREKVTEQSGAKTTLPGETRQAGGAAPPGGRRDGKRPAGRRGGQGSAGRLAAERARACPPQNAPHPGCFPENSEKKPGRRQRRTGGGHTIFSCLTFLSMTWREASSARTSSKEMPISAMSTSTW